MLSHSTHVSHLKVGGAPATFKAFYAVSVSGTSAPFTLSATDLNYFPADRQGPPQGRP